VHQIPTARPARRRTARLAAVVLGVTLLAGALAGPASAKEITSGGGGGGTVTCSPISSLSAKGDARVGETGLASVDVNYSVKPCVDGQAVTVRVLMTESANPSVVVWDDAAAPQSGRFTVLGIRVGVSYRVTVSVTDAATGAVVGLQSIFAGAARKVGV